jgi:hypothetical protein
MVEMPDLRANGEIQNRALVLATIETSGLVLQEMPDLRANGEIQNRVAPLLRVENIKLDLRKQKEHHTLLVVAIQRKLINLGRY